MKRKILCVCNGGNCRSPALAEALKGTFGCDAIAIGTYWAEEETMKMLCLWADVIAIVEPLEASLPLVDLGRWKDSPVWRFPEKIKIARVGPDVWGHSNHDGLMQVCVAAARELLGLL